MNADDLARARTAAQLLRDRKRRSPAAVVRRLLAVQAQDFASVPLALRVRSRGLERSDVVGALDSGELVIGTLNRGTLHLVCREDYGWLHALTAPTTLTANARRLAQEGVTNPGKAVRGIVKALADGPLLRRELGERIGLSGPALTHCLLAASLSGDIVRGPVRGREQAWVLTGDHLGELGAVDREAALAELAARYAKGHSPASDDDLAYWSGLPLRDVRGRLPRRDKSALTPFVTGRLLPPFDPYIMGWRERSFAIPPALAKRVTPGGGMFRAVVLVDGRVTGTWSRSGGRVKIDAPPADGIDAEIADVERFLGE